MASSSRIQQGSAPIDSTPQENEVKPETTTPAIQFNQEEQAFHKHLTLGIEEKLQKNRMIKDIKLIIRKPIEKITLSAWERKNCVSLPSDVRDYYQSTNGFKLTWSLEHAGDNLKIGEMNINQLNQLVPLESYQGGQGMSGAVKASASKPLIALQKNSHTTLKGKSLHSKLNGKFPSKMSTLPSGSEEMNDPSFQMSFAELRQMMEGNSQIRSQDPGGLFLLPNDKSFVLDHNRYGWVCLIYPAASNKAESIKNISPRSPKKSENSTVPTVTEPNVEIWFMDPSFQWHYLAPTFSHYYRMLLFHLGLPQWQYRFTPYGLSSWAEQMFWLVAPHLLTPPKISKFPSIYHAGGLWSTDVPAEATAPNSTPNILTNQIFRRKKRDKEKTEAK